MSLATEITVTVDEKYLRAGVPRSPFSCPIASVINDMLGEDAEASLCDDNMIITTGDGRYSYEVPPEATTFIIRFDDDLPVSVPQTFTFKLRQSKEGDM